MGASIPYGNYYNEGGLWCPYLHARPQATSMGEIADDLRSASSPLGQQSDSEGSTSSFDLGQSVAGMEITNSSKGSVKCRWTDCGLCFGHLDLLASHVTRVHAQSGQGGLFYCGWEGCTRGDRGFNARYKMLVHVRTHTNEKPHRCFKCGKSFSRAENLKIHARSHTGERPYACPIVGCGKAYSNSSDRFKHTRTHSVDKPYICKVIGCPKRYTDPSSLRKHVKTYRHYPDVEKEQSDLPNIMPSLSATALKELPTPKIMKRDSNGDIKTFSNYYDKDPKKENLSQQELFVNGQGSQYDLFRSWLNADLAVLSRSLPMGLSLWNHPLLNEQNYVKSLYEGQTMKHCRMDSTSSQSSDDTVDDLVNCQELPLDLTIHQTSART